MLLLALWALSLLPAVDAAAVSSLRVTCVRTRIEGVTEVSARYVRVQVTLASDLTNVLASRVVRVGRNQRFSATLNYPRQREGTLLVVSAGEWDGSQYLRPATISSAACSSSGNTTPTVPPPPTLFPTPTWVPTLPPTPQNGIAYFTADRTSIEEGGCVTLSYWVVGAQSVTLFGSNWTGQPEVINDNPNQRIVCPSAAGGYVPGQPVTYTLNAVLLDGSSVSASVTIQVGTLPTPAPTPVLGDFYTLQWAITPTLMYDTCGIAPAQTSFTATLVYDTSWTLVGVGYGSNMHYWMSPPVTGPYLGQTSVGDTQYTLDLYFNASDVLVAFEAVTRGTCIWQYRWDGTKLG
ncbi:MAG: hypothetical protein U0694_00815 [Anaerolineae bacterium]